MVESVDTRDLKSLEHCARAGATPVGGTRYICSLVGRTTAFKQ